MNIIVKYCSAMLIFIGFGYIGFITGRIFPLGILLIFIPFIVSVIISILGIRNSLHTKKFNIFSLAVLVLISSCQIGIAADRKITEETINMIKEVRNELLKEIEKSGIITEEMIRDISQKYENIHIEIEKKIMVLVLNTKTQKYLQILIMYF